MTELALTTDILVLDPGDMAEQISALSDLDLDSLIEITDNAATANRLGRIERGRRTELQQGRPLLHGSRSSQAELNRRSEERTVAEWFDSSPDAEKTVEKHGWKKLVDIARGKSPHVSHNSGDNEWYTPPELIAAPEPFGKLRNRRSPREKRYRNRCVADHRGISVIQARRKSQYRLRAVRINSRNRP